MVPFLPWHGLTWFHPTQRGLNFWGDLVPRNWQGVMASEDCIFCFPPRGEVRRFQAPVDQKKLDQTCFVFFGIKIKYALHIQVSHPTAERCKMSGLVVPYFLGSSN